MHNSKPSPRQLANSAVGLEASAEPTGNSSRDIRSSYADCAAYSLMVGFGETYLPAFALAVGLGQIVSGLLASIPLIAGGVLQLLAPWGATLLGSCRRWVVICASLQGLSYLPLALFAAYGDISAPMLFVLAAIYWGSGMAGGPVWNTWIEAIVPKSRLGGFIAIRSRITQLAAFLAFLGGGLFLDAFQDNSQGILTAFVWLFCAAGATRALSVLALSRQSDAQPPTTSPLRLRELLARFSQPAAGRFLFYLLVVQASVHIAAPYFTPYLLAHVKFSYAEYVALVSAAYLAKILFYPQMTAFVMRVGAYRALWIAGLGVSPAPLFWFLTPSLAAMIALQIVAGIIWGVFELASALLIFDRIAPKERIRILTVYNLFNALALAAGSAIGALILAYMPQDLGYKLIFELSALARALSLLSLFGIKHMRVRMKSVAFRIVGLRPGRGAMPEPVFLADSDDRYNKTS